MSMTTRLLREVLNLWTILSFADYVRYVLGIIVLLPVCIKSRRLARVDARMNKDFVLTKNGIQFRIPVKKIDEILGPLGDTPSFGGIREMISNDVYLRAFSIAGNCSSVVDLGSNRGFFMILASKILKAQMVVGVEPQARYDPIWKILQAENGLGDESVVRIRKMIAQQSAEDAITMNELVASYDLRHIDFLKCDVEGTEFELMDQNIEWLGIVDNIAIEVHQGDRNKLIASLRRHHFEIKALNQEGAVCDISIWEYIYASRTSFKIGGAGRTSGRTRTTD